MIESAGYEVKSSRQARETISAVADSVFGVDEDGVANMLSMLRGWVRDFPKVSGNGFAQLATTDSDSVFKDVFVLYEASVKVAMHSSMRVVSVDAAHVQGRKDLRIILLEGINANNNIYPIAFSICFLENIWQKDRDGPGHNAVRLQSSLAGWR
eukprot:SAG31_NODE_4614_length_3095_cov_76.629172_2_plen_154_part_00